MHGDSGDGAAWIGFWNALVGEGDPGSASQRIRNACNLRLAPSCSLWIFNSDLQPSLYSSIRTFPWLFGACMTSMTTIILDRVEF